MLLFIRTSWRQTRSNFRSIRRMTQIISIGSENSINSDMWKCDALERGRVDNALDIYQMRKNQVLNGNGLCWGLNRWNGWHLIATDHSPSKCEWRPWQGERHSYIGLALIDTCDHWLATVPPRDWMSHFGVEKTIVAFHDLEVWMTQELTHFSLTWKVYSLYPLEGSGPRLLCVMSLCILSHVLTDQQTHLRNSNSSWITTTLRF